MQPDFEIWLDTHLSPIIAKWLTDDFGYVFKSSFILKFDGLDDIDIYKKAKDAGFIILLTKDSDFADLIERFGAPPKVINLEAENMKSRILYSLLKTQIERSVRLLTQFDHNSIELYLRP